jgi:DNA-binding beta-propeller fold protein YncE
LANTIHKFGPTGADLGTFASTGVSQPSSLAFDKGGNLYVGNQGSHSIHEFGPTGVDLGTFASTATLFPNDLAFDGSGNLYVADQGTDSILEFGPTGADLGTFADRGVSAHPLALAFAPVPEPSSFLLLVLGAFGFWKVSRATRRQTST